MLIEKPIRATWDDFPDVLIFAEEGAVRRHPEYVAAKTGDVSAAKRLAAGLISAEIIASVAWLVGVRDAMLLPVHALEAGGVNRIPAAMAEAMAELLGERYSAKLALSAQTLHLISERYGKELESWWRQSFGYGFDKLTESEARYLLRAENADTIRNRIAEARSKAKP